MGSIRIQTQSERFRIQFQDGISRVANEENPKQAPLQALRSSHTQPKAGLENYLPTAEKPQQAMYLERISPRQTSATLGSDTVSFEMGYQTRNQGILTSAQEPTLEENARALAQSPMAGNGGKSAEKGLPLDALAGKMIMTGTRIKPHENVTVQLGLASVVNSKQREQEEGIAQELQSATKHGFYAGVNVNAGDISTQVNLDTTLGQPRVGAGLAYHLGETITVGISYVRQPEAQKSEENILRLGAEVYSFQDTALGINLTHPLSGSAFETQQAAVGMYCNTKF